MRPHEPAHAHYSRATLAGHPIHPMLVAFPVAFYTGGVASLVAYAVNRDGFWFHTAEVALFAGVIAAAAAAVFGAIDLFVGVPPATPARATGLRHLAVNAAALVLFAISAGLVYRELHPAPAMTSLDALPVAVPLLLSALGLALTGIAGALGWKLVQTHHVGVDEHGTSRTTLPGYR